MADVLSVSFKIDTGSLEGDAAAAGKLAAKAFEQGFGALDLKTPMAKAGEAAKAQVAAIGKTLQGAATQHADAVEKALAGAGSEKGGGGGKALALGGLLGGLLPKNFGRDIAESAEVGAKGLGTLRAAFALICWTMASPRAARCWSGASSAARRRQRKRQARLSPGPPPRPTPPRRK